MSQQYSRIVRQLLVVDISSLGTYFRIVPSKLSSFLLFQSNWQFDGNSENHYGNLIREIIIPFIYVMNKEFQCPPCSIALPEGAIAERLDFWDLDGCDKILSTMDFKSVQYSCFSSSLLMTMTLYVAFTSPTPDHQLGTTCQTYCQSSLLLSLTIFPQTLWRWPIPLLLLILLVLWLLKQLQPGQRKRDKRQWMLQRWWLLMNWKNM